MIIPEYISDLLCRYDCVIVPNLGGFITQKIGAKYDSSSNLFLPPSKKISFNEHLKDNDGLLANYIASVENIPFDQANNKISKQVLLWKNKLNTSCVKINKIGILLLNDNNKIVFEPNLKTNLLIESFGLTNLEFNKIQRVKKYSITKPRQFKTKEINKQKTTFKLIKYAATAAILITLGTIGFNIINKQNKKTIFLKNQKELEQKIQKATFIVNEPLPTINLKINKKPKKNYFVIAGAFESVKNAKKKLIELQNKGYNALILNKNKWGLIQVAFGGFYNNLKARKLLKKIKKTELNEAWLLVKKK